MKLIHAIRGLAAATVLALGALPAVAATQTYFLNEMTLQTGNAAGTYYFQRTFAAGDTLLSNSWCLSCASGWNTIVGSTGLAVLDTDTNAVSITNLEWSLRNFGANFREDSDGTTAVGGSSYVKSFDSCTLYGGTATQYCNTADPRAYAGNWYDGLRADGTTVCNSCELSVAIDGNWLRMVLRKPLRADDPVGTASWLQIGYNFQVVPVPGAVWLMGGAIAALGWLRRKQAAA